MVKESILFVVSTGLLIYFVTPSEDPPKADAGADEVQTQVTPPVQSSDDGWGYEDGEEQDDESFVFGEPLTSFDNDYETDSDDTSSADEEEGSSRREQQADAGRSSSRSASRSQPKYSPNSPQPSEKGGIDNPIVFETRTPSDPVDD